MVKYIFKKCIGPELRFYNKFIDSYQPYFDLLSMKYRKEKVSKHIVGLNSLQIAYIATMERLCDVNENVTAFSCCG